MGNRETRQGGPTLSNSLTMADITSGSQHLLVGPGSSLRIGLSLLIPEAAINQLEICRCRIRCFLRLYFLTDIFSIYKCNGFVSLLKFILLKKIICSYSLEGDDNFHWYFSFSCLFSLFPILWMVPVSLSRGCQVNETAQRETLFGNSNKAWRIGFLIRNNKSFLSGEHASSGHVLMGALPERNIEAKRI